MGVDTKIILPGDVRVRDVAEVIGILAGNKPVWEEGGGGARWVTVPGAQAKPHSSMAECCDIEFERPDWLQNHCGGYVLWHWEYKGKRLLMPRSTAFWIACGQRLVRFFGGSIIPSDCRDEVLEHVAKPRKTNCPEGGKEWDDFQNAMFNLEPLTMEDLLAANHYAAYKLEDQ